jgi:hypothetical protein
VIGSKLGCPLLWSRSLWSVSAEHSSCPGTTPLGWARQWRQFASPPTVRVQRHLEHTYSQGRRSNSFGEIHFGGKVAWASIHWRALSSSTGPCSLWRWHKRSRERMTVGTQGAVSLSLLVHFRAGPRGHPRLRNDVAHEVVIHFLPSKWFFVGSAILLTIYLNE